MEARGFLREAWGLMSIYRPSIVKASCWVLAFQVAALIPPFIAAHIYDVMSHKGVDDVTKAYTMAVLLLVTLVIMGWMKKLKDSLTRKVTFVIVRDLPPRCLDKLLRLPQSYHERENTGQAVGKVLKGVGRLIDLTHMMQHEILPLVGMGVCTISMVLYYDWRIAIVILFTMGSFSTLAIRAHAKMYAYRHERHELDSECDAQFGQAVTNAMTVQVCGQEARELATQRRMSNRIYDMLHVEYDAYDGSELGRNWVVNAISVAIIFCCIRFVSKGTMPLGIMVLVAMLSERLFSACFRIGWFYSKAVECEEPIKRVAALLAMPETVQDPREPIVVGRFRGEVAFHEVTYCYKTSDPTVPQGIPRLRHVSFTAKAGETVAIVGQSGAGKSTLAKLLLRFDDPDQGCITIDGDDLRSMRKIDFRTQIGYVPQDVEIFDTSIAENIAYARPAATRAEIIEAARSAGALHFIERDCERGFETQVGNRGLKLSGGQRQRIGLARALLLDPPILLFDEATSSVDSVTEAEIQPTIRRQLGKRTVFLIAHRLSTVRHADRILVMDQGRIVETGTHVELMRLNGVYTAMVRAQEDADLVDSLVPSKVRN